CAFLEHRRGSILTERSRELGMLEFEAARHHPAVQRAGRVTDPGGVEHEHADAMAPQLERSGEAAVPGADDRDVDAIRERRHRRRRGRRGFPPVRRVLEVRREDLCGGHASAPSTASIVGRDQDLTRYEACRRRSATRPAVSTAAPSTCPASIRTYTWLTASPPLTQLAAPPNATPRPTLSRARRIRGPM